MRSDRRQTMSRKRSQNGRRRRSLSRRLWNGLAVLSSVGMCHAAAVGGVREEACRDILEKYGVTSEALRSMIKQQQQQQGQGQQRRTGIRYTDGVRVRSKGVAELVEPLLPTC
mmetsp:Transcript_3906/g.10998  ORF Transcript_3906/g.10998 Transcript_3906/m.10998 type:complete len:113 (+) Transcript_3906:94-432(+)